MASLGKDLAAIRKEQGLSFEDIYEATKIPKHIINSIEDDTIFTDFDENATYIRSYVRSYAKALSIDEQQIIYALDQQKIEKYSGSLRDSGEAEQEPEDEEVQHEEQPVTDETASAEPEDSEAEPVADDLAGGAAEADEEPAATTDPNATGKSSGPFRQKTPPRSKNVDWGNMGSTSNSAKPRSNLWIGIALLTLLLAGGVYFIAGIMGNGEAETEEPAQQENEGSEPVNEADTLQLDIVPPAEEDTTESPASPATAFDNTTRESLADTLEVIVYAAFDKLEPVRVYTDVMGNTNPYWVEQGDAIRFDFVNEFRIRGSQNDMLLMMNGHVIEDVQERFYNADTRLVEIDRSYFEEDDKWLQPPPDTLPVDAPLPTVIRERPTYN